MKMLKLLLSITCGMIALYLISFLLAYGIELVYHSNGFSFDFTQIVTSLNLLIVSITVFLLWKYTAATERQNELSKQIINIQQIPIIKHNLQYELIDGKCKFLLTIHNKSNFEIEVYVTVNLLTVEFSKIVGFFEDHKLVNGKTAWLLEPDTTFTPHFLEFIVNDMIQYLASKNQISYSELWFDLSYYSFSIYKQKYTSCHHYYSLDFVNGILKKSFLKPDDYALKIAKAKAVLIENPNAIDEAWKIFRQE